MTIFCLFHLSSNKWDITVVDMLDSENYFRLKHLSDIVLQILFIWFYGVSFGVLVKVYTIFAFYLEVHFNKVFFFHVFSVETVFLFPCTNRKSDVLRKYW